MNLWIMLTAVLAAAGLLTACGSDSGEVAANAPVTAESSTDSTTAEEPLGSPQLYELQYPLTEFKFPSYELTSVLTDVEDE